MMLLESSCCQKKLPTNSPLSIEMNDRTHLRSLIKAGQAEPNGCF
jgi:hypothetical protein